MEAKSEQLGAGQPQADVSANSLKEAVAGLKQALTAYRTQVAGAEKELTAVESERNRSIQAARKKLADDAKPRKVGSLGTMRKVTVTETTIQTPKGTFPLVEGIRAASDQHGMKQVVQGWVFKSDQDRREVYLHIEGPGWADVVPYNIKNAWVTPAQIHTFATTINGASANAPALGLQVVRRTQLAQQQLANELDKAAPLREAAARLVVQAADSELVDQWRTYVDQMITAVDEPENRKVKKAAGQMEEARAEVENRREAANARAESVRQDLERLEQEAKEIRAEARETQAKLPEGADRNEAINSWLDDVADRLVPLGLTESARFTGVHLGGTTMLGDIALHEGKTKLFVNLFADDSLAEQAATNLAAGKSIARAIKQGVTRLETHGRVVLLANNSPRRLAEETFAAFVQVVEGIEPPDLPPEPGPKSEEAKSDVRAGQSGSEEVMQALAKLGELHEAGVLTDEEFATKKAELLARI